MQLASLLDDSAELLADKCLIALKDEASSVALGNYGVDECKEGVGCEVACEWGGVDGVVRECLYCFV